MKRIFAVLAAAGLGMGALAGCGGSSKPSSASTTGGGSSPGGLTTIKVAYTAVGAGYADLYVGTLDGIFKKNGLNVKLDNLDNSSILVPSLVSGSVQVGVGVANDTAAAILKGQKLRYIAMSEPVYNLQVWGKKSITGVAGLVGQKVAVSGPGSESFFGLAALLKKNHIPASKVDTVDVANPQAQVAALESGSVDAILTQPPNGSQTAAHGMHEIASLNSLPFALGTYTVSASYLKSHASVVRRFVKAEVENLAFLRSHPSATLSAIEKDSGVSNPKLAKQAYQFFLGVWAKDPKVPSSLIKTAFQVAAKKDGKTAPSSVSKYIDNSFVDAASAGSAS